MNELGHRGSVDHRIGVRRTAKRGDAAAHGRAGLAGDGRLVFGARLAQACAQIDDAGYQRLPGGLDIALGFESVRGGADALYAAVGDEHIGDGIRAVCRVDNPGACDAHAHQPPSRSAAAWLPMAMDMTAMRMAMP